MLLKISQNSQENTLARVSFLIKLLAQGVKLYLKNTLGHRCFPVNFDIFKINYFTEHLWTTISNKRWIQEWTCENSKTIKDVINSYSNIEFFITGQNYFSSKQHDESSSNILKDTNVRKSYRTGTKTKASS